MVRFTTVCRVAAPGSEVYRQVTYRQASCIQAGERDTRARVLNLYHTVHIKYYSRNSETLNGHSRSQIPGQRRFVWPLFLHKEQLNPFCVSYHARCRFCRLGLQDLARRLSGGLSL